MKRPVSPAQGVALLLALTAMLAFGRPAPTAPPAARVVPPDLSGLAWVKDNIFLAVHDAKAPGLARVSVVFEPQSAAGPLVRPLRIKGLEDEPFDLESITRVPPIWGAPENTPPAFLLAESGSNPRFRRIFYATYQDGDEITLRHVGAHSVFLQRADVESLAALRVGERILAFAAGRAEGQRSTLVAGQTITVDGNPRPFVEGEQINFSTAIPDPSGPRGRQVSDLAFDGNGYLYAASAEDPGVDTGPYRSSVWRLGWARYEGGHFSFEPERDGDRFRPVRVATVDGMKIESLAFRELKPGFSELFFGTDDEFYGGAMRSLGVLPR